MTSTSLRGRSFYTARKSSRNPRRRAEEDANGGDPIDMRPGGRTSQKHLPSDKITARDLVLAGVPTYDDSLLRASRFFDAAIRKVHPVARRLYLSLNAENRKIVMERVGHLMASALPAGRVLANFARQGLAVIRKGDLAVSVRVQDRNQRKDTLHAENTACAAYRIKQRALKYADTFKHQPELRKIPEMCLPRLDGTETGHSWEEQALPKMDIPVLIHTYCGGDKYAKLHARAAALKLLYPSSLVQDLVVGRAILAALRSRSWLFSSKHHEKNLMHARRLRSRLVGEGGVRVSDNLDGYDYRAVGSVFIVEDGTVWLKKSVAADVLLRLMNDVELNPGPAWDTKPVYLKDHRLAAEVGLLALSRNINLACSWDEGQRAIKICAHATEDDLRKLVAEAKELSGLNGEWTCEDDIYVCTIRLRSRYLRQWNQLCPSWAVVSQTHIDLARQEVTVMYYVTTIAQARLLPKLAQNFNENDNGQLNGLNGEFTNSDGPSGPPSAAKPPPKGRGAGWAADEERPARAASHSRPKVKGRGNVAMVQAVAAEAQNLRGAEDALRQLTAEAKAAIKEAAEAESIPQRIARIKAEKKQEAEEAAKAAQEAEEDAKLGPCNALFEWRSLPKDRLRLHYEVPTPFSMYPEAIRRSNETSPSEEQEWTVAHDPRNARSSFVYWTSMLMCVVFLALALSSVFLLDIQDPETIDSKFGRWLYDIDLTLDTWVGNLPGRVQQIFDPLVTLQEPELSQGPWKQMIAMRLAHIIISLIGLALFWIFRGPQRPAYYGTYDTHVVRVEKVEDYTSVADTRAVHDRGIPLSIGGESLFKVQWTYSTRRGTLWTQKETLYEGYTYARSALSATLPNMDLSVEAMRLSQMIANRTYTSLNKPEIHSRNTHTGGLVVEAVFCHRWYEHRRITYVTGQPFSRPPPATPGHGC